MGLWQSKPCVPQAEPPPPAPPAKKPLQLTDLQRAKFDLKAQKEKLERLTKSQYSEAAVRWCGAPMGPIPPTRPWLLPPPPGPTLNRANK